MTGHNPVDRSKLGTKRHILTDKNGIPISVVISSATTHDIKLVTDVVDNVVIKRPSSYKTKKTRSKNEKEKEDNVTTQHCSNRKKHSAKRWVVERTNSWHNRFRKLFTRYEKKVENYLGLVQLSCSIIIYRKIILR